MIHSNLQIFNGIIQPSPVFFLTFQILFAGGIISSGSAISLIPCVIV